MAKINLSGYVDSSIVDGPGVRFAVYTQGCSHSCPGCHNPDTWSFDQNRMMEVADLVAIIEDESLGRNVTISGGDPLFQIEATLELVKILKEKKYNIWLYTGFELEEIQNDSKKCEILNYIDVLVDGRFEQDAKDLELKYRGSSNQRVIDCKTFKDLY